MNPIKKYFRNRKVNRLQKQKLRVAQLASMARLTQNGDAYQILQKQYRKLEQKIKLLDQ
jgi:hypothetical protein